MTQLFHAVQSVAEVATANASRHLQQLCRHFQRHRFPVVFDERSGRIEFSFGECRLEASDGVLRLSLSAPSGRQMTELQDVVAGRLARFAVREPVRIEWRPAGAAADEPSADRTVIRAVATLARTMGVRVTRGSINPAAAATIAAALDAATQTVERT